MTTEQQAGITPKSRDGNAGMVVAAARRLKAIDLRQVGLPIAVLALIVYFSFTSDVFFTTQNWQNIGLQAAALACVAFGQAYVVLTAGIDLSVGSTVALVSIVAAMAMGHGLLLGITIALLVGALVGLVNGLVITRLRVAPFIATLAMLSIAAGLALNISGGTPIVGLPRFFTSLAYSKVVGIPVPVILAVLVFAVAYFLLRATRLGRNIYATGGNAEAARLSGISTRRTILSAYVICSVLAAFGGLILTSRVASGQPSLGGDLALQSVAAVVLGGVSLFGGRGGLIGVAFGVAFVTVLTNGLNLMNVSSYTQLMVVGAAMIVAIALDQYLSRKWRIRGEV
jgi:Ribose/xylose/arabinose/galactoside ABC-type transport systems, permease components